MLRRLAKQHGPLLAAARMTSAAAGSAPRTRWTAAPPLVDAYGPSSSDSYGESTSHVEGGSSMRSKSEQEDIVKQILRESQAAEAAATRYFVGQQRLLCNRPDAAFFTAREQEQLDAVSQLMPQYQARPSLLLGAAEVAGMSLGALAALAPATVSRAIAGALQDALTDVYTDQLRRLREAGLSEQASEVRETVKRLRDLERAPHGAPPAPDIVALQQMERIEDIGVQGVVGAVVKAATRAALVVTRSV